MNLETQTDAGSPPTRTRRPSLCQSNRLPTEFGRVCHGRHTSPNQHPTVNRRSTEFGRVRLRGHTTTCRRHPIEAGVVSVAGDTSTCEGGLCLS